MDDDVLKQVPKFKYLGSIFTEDGESKEDVIRVKEAKIIFNNRKQLLCSNNLCFGNKKETYKKLYLEYCSLCF